jgi:hypothetical protein
MLFFLASGIQNQEFAGEKDYPEKMRSKKMGITGSC